jgi:hypothetical protein
MSYKTQMLRNQIMVGLLTIILLTVCSSLIGFTNMLKTVLFVSVALTCLVGGSIFITMRLGQNERLAFVILAAWYGFSFALLSLVGMLMDPRSSAFSWAYFLKVAGIIGVGTFLFIVLLTPVGMAALRFWRKNFGAPMSHRESK